jgi:hypothetical protein
MSSNLRLSSLLLASLIFTAACDKKDRKDNDTLPQNTAAVTFHSLARFQALNQQLTLSMVRSFKGFSQLRPADRIGALWSAVSGQAVQVVPEGSDPLPAFRRSFNAAASLPGIQPIQKLAQAVLDDEPEELFNNVMKAVLQHKYAEFAADGMIFYRLDGLNPMCEGNEECLRTLKIFRLGVGSDGDKHLNIQLSHLRQGIVNLRLGPVGIDYLVKFDALNALLEPNDGVQIKGSVKGFLTLEEERSTLNLNLIDEFHLRTKDEATGGSASLSIAWNGISLVMHESREPNHVYLSLRLGQIEMKSGESSFLIPGSYMSMTATDNTWNAGIDLWGGSFSVPSEDNPGTTNTWSIIFDEPLRVSVESEATTSGTLSLKTSQIHVKENERELASLSIKPDLKANLGADGINVVEGQVTLVRDGQSKDLLKPQACYRPVLDGADETDNSDREFFLDNFLEAIPCPA